MTATSIETAEEIAASSAALARVVEGLPRACRNPECKNVIPEHLSRGRPRNTCSEVCKCVIDKLKKREVRAAARAAR